MSIATERRAQVSVQIGKQEISFETGHLAKQADGAVVVRGGETMVLATAQGRAEAREGADFFPLTVDVEERMYAAGKIPGGFFKREGRPTERAILTARMIDRPIRPLWPKGFRNEVQVICTVLSADMVTAHDILCINGASAALMLSPLPFLGPVGAVRVGLIDGQLVVNPTLRESEDNGELDLIVVGTKEGLTMVEAGANEIPEEKILEALELAHGEIVKLCEAQEDLRRQAGKPKWLDLDLLAELERDQAHAIWERIQQAGIKESGTVVDELLAELAPPITMESTDDDIQRQMQVKSALALLLEKQRAVAVEGPVREQFGDELKALTDAEQDSKALKSAKRQLLFDRIVEEVDLPFPVGGASVDPDTGEPLPASKDSQTSHRSRRRASRSTRISCGRRSPSTSGARTAAAPRRSGRSRSRSASTRVRTAPACSRAARRRSSRRSRSARRRRGSGSTTSRSRTTAATCTTTTSRRTRSGRRASCAARSGVTSATARSRSGRSRRSSRRRRSSRTRSASSRRRSSRTARRRWAPSAARRCR